MEITDQQKHLEHSLKEQKKLISEINELNNQIALKKELVLKHQGVIEYLNQIGVKLPKSVEKEIEVGPFTNQGIPAMISE